MKQTLQILSFSFLKTFTEKIFLTLILLAIAQQVLAQFNDNFDDGSLSSDPVWSFDETRFTVSAGQLRLMAPPVADVSYLTTECAAINGASWEFYVRLTFNPSSSNYCRIYLTSDQADLTGTVNGYYVMIGNTADEISLYNQSGTSRVKIIDGTDGRLNNTASEMKIKVLRDDEGNWQLFSDVGLTGHFILEGAARDEEHFSSSYFGILCTYTATRSDRFYFDDIIVSGNPYIPPPPAEYKDVIITEIFPDPAPRVELPESEFLEIYNRSENNFNISDWQLADGTSVASLPNFSLSTGKYLILTSTSSVADFVSYGDVIGVPGFPSLNNAADAVTLRSTTGLLIDSVRYESSWYKSDIKREGGWSLELIDPANKCGEENNWTESEDTAGGTPGKINSVLADKPDVTGPLLLSAIPSSATELLVYFNEKLSNTLPDSQHFTVAPTNHVLTTAFLDQGMRVLRLQLAEPLQPRILYSLSSTAVYDCAANLLQAGTSTVSFALPETSDTLDVVINEILFNPKPTGVDFVEIVNASEKYLNLESWALVNSESKEHTHKITDDNILFGPGEYRVLTTDKNVLIGEYLNTAEDRVIEVASLPSMNDDEGSIALLNEAGKITDHLVYTKDLHSVFIKDEEGVSLERISVTHATNDPQNWKSASSLSGFATPGFINSQSRPEEFAADAVVISPEIFIPVTGQPDFTEIQYHFDQGGYVANVKILDSNGREIRRLANNEVLGTTGFIRWDGDQDDGSKARIGYYMVWFEIVDVAGTIRTYRKRLAVAARF